MMRYFTYGSNMDKNDLDSWCDEKGLSKVTFHNPKPVKLRDYRLAFNYFSKTRNAGAANIMDAPGHCLYGLLVEINQPDLKTIRRKEGFPSYYDEVPVDVETLGGERVQGVMTYKAVKKREKQKHQPPTMYYRELIIKNAREYGFPQEYVDHLESISTTLQLKLDLSFSEDLVFSGFLPEDEDTLVKVSLEENDFCARLYMSRREEQLSNLDGDLNNPANLRRCSSLYCSGLTMDLVISEVESDIVNALRTDERTEKVDDLEKRYVV